MFNFKNLSGLTQLMMNAGSITDRIREMRESLANQTATGSAAEGSIHVEVSGTGEVQRLTICTSLIQTGSTDQIEVLLPQALNEALAKVRQMHIAKVRELTGGVDIPGLDDALSNL
jgi:DNA-binding protein YbaB